MLLQRCSVAAFKQQAFAFLATNEAQNNVIFGLVDQLLTRPDLYPDAYLWILTEGEAVIGAAWWAPPHPLSFSAMPEAGLQLLLEEVKKLPHDLTASVGPKAQSDLYAALWAQRHGRPSAYVMEQRLYQLDEVQALPRTAGRMIQATAAEAPLVVEWSQAFVRDSGLNASADYTRSSALRAVQQGTRFLWRDAQDQSTAMVGLAGFSPRGIRLSWVYTPEHRRGQGYASALVAAISQKVLDDGRAFVFLYTDLANPTSNSIYQKIGFRPLVDASYHSYAT